MFLGSEHLCFRVDAMGEQLDVGRFEEAYAAEGRMAYPPRMMLKVWLYAFCLGVIRPTTAGAEDSRRSGRSAIWPEGLGPDHKTLSEFLRRQTGVAINDRVHAGSGRWPGGRDWESWATWPSTRRACGQCGAAKCGGLG